MAFLSVKITPNASKDAFAGWQGDILKIRLHTPPEKGKANAALIDFLAEKLGVAKSQIQIVSGHTSRLKRLSIDGITLEEIAKRAF